LKRTLTVAGVVAVVAAVSVTAFAVQASSASSKQRAVAASAVVHRDVISLSAAQKLASAAQAECAKRGIAVSVAVVDTDGVDILLQRADGTTGATVAVARGKARAAAGFQSPTAALNEAAKTTPGLISVPDFVILPGGEPIMVGKTLIGGVGVSGAPSGDIDDACAQAGLAAIA
jgi:uncharacterized protein GlcG (DUF336 family)